MTSKATSETKLSDESHVSQLEKILKEQVERAEKERTELMAMLKQQADLLNKLTAVGNASGNPTTIMPVLSPEEILANTIHAKLGDFNYDPEAESTFDIWYRRYKSVLEEDGKLLQEEHKVRMLCRRLSDAVFKRLVEITSPNEPEKTKYADLIRILDETFGSKATLFSKRYEVMRMAIRSGEDLIGYLDKALVFVSGLKTPECEEIRRRILHVLEAKPNAKLVDLRSECEAYQKLKTNVQVVTEERGFAAQKAKLENDQWKKHQAH
uniref:Gag protein n=1 Tax=Acrobeloides nanus TaxID=290746 RepID=A0A914D9G4_9BILA